jgi:hypothetical protein
MLYTRNQILTQPSPVPKRPGVYGWYFKRVPPSIPADEYVTWNALTLLYIGISPSRPGSKHNLRKRIRTHYRGNAYGSTLRKSLGCLLGEELGIHLQRVGESSRLIHFGSGEEVLSDWMAENAFVTWIEYERPWEIEEELILLFKVPLNLRENEEHPFYHILSKLRAEGKKMASMK